VTIVLDIDGVVWLAGTAIPGSPEAIARLREAGERVLLVSNNSGPTLGQYRGMLAAAGVDVEEGDLATSAQAAASMLEPGTTAAAVGGPGIPEALSARGVRVVSVEDHPEAVVVGRSTELDYAELAAAASAIRAGARFVATNTDSTYPSPTGLLPGAGATVAFVATAAGRAPEVAGKPNRPVAELVRARAGRPGYMVGDRADTDGVFAGELGARFALVLSGSTRPGDLPVEPPPALVAADLAEAVERILAEGAGRASVGS
jgi:glycerol 3-phosphatase-2